MMFCPITRRASRVLRLAAALLATGAGARAADELAPFLAVHRKATALSEKKDWAEAAKAYATFAAANEGDPCAPLAWALQGILLRRELNAPDKAREAFLRAAKAPNTPFGQATAELARGWLARLQMEQLDEALRRYWVAHVEYPETLEALAKGKLATPEMLVDPWGKPFAYTAAALKARPDLPRQVYSLRSTSLAGDSRSIRAYLHDTLKLPKKFQLKAIGGVKPLAALIAFADEPARRPVNLAEGEKLDGATLVKLTPQGAILFEGGAVAVLAR